MDVAVGGEHAARSRGERTAIDRRHAATGLGHDQSAGGHVPGLEFVLPESIESPGRHIAEIQSRRAETANRASTRNELTEEADEFLLMGLRLSEGIDLDRYEQLAGRPLASDRLSILQGEGIVAPVGNSRLRATPAGMIVLDAVVADLAR